MLSIRVPFYKQRYILHILDCHLLFYSDVFRFIVYYPILWDLHAPLVIFYYYTFNRVDEWG